MMLATKTFSQDDQIAFARYSGDWNPIHVDPVYARRTQIGQQVVHGMHALLWALDAFARSSAELKRFRSVEVDFLKPIYLDEPIVANIIDSPSRMPGTRTLKIGLYAAGVALVTIALNSSAPILTARATYSGKQIAGASAIEPIALEIGDIRERAGVVPLVPSSPAFEDHYGHAVTGLGTRRFRGIATLSRLVGMECPGLHSLFMGAQLALGRGDRRDDLHFAVQEVDDRFQLIRMAIKGADLDGLVTARVRAKPVVQPALAEIAACVAPGEFSGQTPLIIGGSRGLGELTAKICAAGGARPTISYFMGEDDARRVADEIVKAGGECSIIRYDVKLNAGSQLGQLSAAPPQQVYYFPTSPIARRKSEPFETVLLDEFLKTYVTGFYDLCRSLRRSFPQNLSVFYPSTTYADHRPRDMTEYVMAKLAGEVLCADLARRDRGLKILVRRLPPLLTDQTAGISTVGSSTQAVEIVLSVVREMARMDSVRAKADAV
jgi:NAD(P)-dependent dehydrogenase (short-subunit alcohol dehydrogenase family)